MIFGTLVRYSTSSTLGIRAVHCIGGRGGVGAGVLGWGEFLAECAVVFECASVSAIESAVVIICCSFMRGMGVAKA